MAKRPAIVSGTGMDAGRPLPPVAQPTSLRRESRDGDMVALASRAGDTTLRARVSERMQPGVVYTTFHHVGTGANVVTTDYSDWATNCPEYKVTAVEVRLSNRPSEWQESYAKLREATRRIAVTAAE